MGLFILGPFFCFFVSYFWPGQESIGPHGLSQEATSIGSVYIGSVFLFFLFLISGPGKKEKDLSHHGLIVVRGDFYWVCLYWVCFFVFLFLFFGLGKKG